MTLTLASRSPRRIELLETLQIPFVVAPADVDEGAIEQKYQDAPPQELALAVAGAKLEAVRKPASAATIVAADTVVALDGVSLGKPTDHGDALDMLRVLGGREHVVVTGVVVRSGDMTFCCAVSSTVCMRTATDEELNDYVSTGEPFDKAGGYAIQGEGAGLIQSLCGCYLTVVGLPLCAVVSCLTAAGLPSHTDAIGFCHKRAIEVARYGSVVRVPSHPPQESIQVRMPS